MKDTGRKERQGVEKRIRISDDLIWGVHPVFEALNHEPERLLEIVLM